MKLLPWLVVSIYLDNLDGVEEGEGQRDEHQEQGADSQEVGDNARALITHDCNYGDNFIKLWYYTMYYTHSILHEMWCWQKQQCYYCAGNIFQIAHSDILHSYHTHNTKLHKYAQGEITMSTY